MLCMCINIMIISLVVLYAWPHIFFTVVVGYGCIGFPSVDVGFFFSNNSSSV